MKSSQRKIETSKLDSLKVKEIVESNILGGGPGVTVGVTVTANWSGWFDGSLVRSLFDGVRGNTNVNEFD